MERIVSNLSRIRASEGKRDLHDDASGSIYFAHGRSYYTQEHRLLLLVMLEASDYILS